MEKIKIEIKKTVPTTSSIEISKQINDDKAFNEKYEFDYEYYFKFKDYSILPYNADVVFEEFDHFIYTEAQIKEYMEIKGLKASIVKDEGLGQYVIQVYVKGKLNYVKLDKHESTNKRFYVLTEDPKERYPIKLLPSAEYVMYMALNHALTNEKN